MKAVVALIAVGLVGVVSSAALPQDGTALPTFIKTCSRDQPDFDACLLSSLQKLHPYLVKGIPELDLPPFDPFKRDEHVTEYSNGFVQFKATVRDFVTYGITGLKFLQVRTKFEDEKDMLIEVDMTVPKMKAEGKYRIQGKFLGSDLFTRGSFEVTLVNVTATWDIHGSLETVDGEKYLKINEFGITPEIGDMRIYASDLFNGNQLLTQTALQLFNQNWRQVYGEIQPHTRKTWDEIMREYANNVFMKVPFDKVFPVSS
ncbi:UNVERIFIED_CONTAM: hypothetical protein PYX00_002463 [Menopon gallinae]|uniref:Uncharacterized protein n=1 Tax=Menopon gallinae TaxID=328185 RepID=A0AAW2IH66_9NEOP